MQKIFRKKKRTSLLMKFDLKMKLTTLFLIISLFQLQAAETYAQKTKVSLNLNNVSLGTVLEKIESLSDFKFIYKIDEVEYKKIVTVKAENERINSILQKLFSDTDIIYKVLNKQIILKQDKSVSKKLFTELLQQIDIKGVVFDKNGLALPGASIVVKGTTNSTSTDMDGKFSIRVDAAATTLVISYIGFDTMEVPIGNKTDFKITLKESSQNLEEVVVVGYGTQKKVTLTGSVVSIKGKDIVKSKSPNVISSLTGNLPGVIINTRTGEPGRENPNILIRGKSTTGNAQALVIINGVERENLGEINPNDIESISVLKDASAAIYGARAANGVILVTTKRGNVGAPTFSFSSNHGFTQPTRTPKMADSYTFAKVYNEIENGEGRSARYSDDELQKFKDGSDSNYANTDWYKVITRNLTPQHRVNLAVQGGTDKVKYFVSFGEQSQEGQFTNTSMKNRRYNLRSNVDVKVNDFFQFGMGLAGRYDAQHYPAQDLGGLYAHTFLYLPSWTPYWPGTNYIRPNRDSESILNMVNDRSGTDDRDSKGLESTLSFRLDIPWAKGLYIDGTANYDVNIDFRKKFTKPTYVYYYNTTTDTYTEGLGGASQPLASLSEYYSQMASLTVNTKINYDKSFGIHNFGVMLGYEQRQSKFNTFEAARSNFVSTALPELFAGSSDKNYQSNTGTAAEYARQNYFGRVTYDYGGKYLAQLIFRYDGSQNFPKDKRYGFFPGISVGWRMSEEQFMKKYDFIDNLKFRASYGEMGNDQVNPFQYLTTYGFGANYVIGNKDVASVVQTGVPNPNITWEKAKTYNFGVDAMFWGGLLGAEFDLFKTRRADILTKRTVLVPDYTGLNLPDENVGIVENKGFELVLTHKSKINKLNYTVSGNISYARNKVIFADEAPAAQSYQLATGRPIGSQLLYNAVGIFANQEEINAYPHFGDARPGDIKYEDVNNDGSINSQDRIRVNENATPQVVYGLNLGFEFKGFDLSILFQGQAKAKVFFDGYFPVMSYSLGNFLEARAEDRWSPQNANASMPRPSQEVFNNNTLPSTKWLYNSGFTRLKNLELGYNVSNLVCKKLSLQSLRIYVSGNNLAILKDHMSKLGFDPETDNYWSYPQQKMYNIGVNINF